MFCIYESCLNSQVSGHLYPLVLSYFLYSCQSYALDAVLYTFLQYYAMRFR